MLKEATILQLAPGADAQELETAYQRTRARFESLTARGPLAYYRTELLAAAQRAYNHLKNPTPVLTEKPRSMLARKVAHLRQNPAPLPQEAEMPDRRPGCWPAATTPRERDLIEDDFCKEIIFRLEGDLIRFDSRRELLQIAQEWGVPIFQANLLMAQIVESVRHHGLFAANSGRKEKNSPGNHQKSGKFRKFLLAAAVFLAVILDWLVISLLNHH